MSNASALIAENQERTAALLSPYDPVTGVGSLTERVDVAWSADVTLRLPVAMLEDPELGNGLSACVEQGRSVAEHCERVGLDFNEAFEAAFNTVRLRHDYEFWAFTCAHIVDKDGALVPLRLNPPQRKSLADREALRLKGDPVRQVELKHRQYGSTTEKQAYVAWQQTEVAPGHNAYVISLDMDAATDIVTRTERLYEHYPLTGVRLRGVGNATKTKRLERDGAGLGYLYLGSAEKPNAASGRTVQHVLISEAGKMGSTAAKGADKLLTNIMSAVPLKPGTTVMVESTAEESGRWFRDTVHKAQRGESGFVLTFISWTTDPQYQITPPSDIEAWSSSWDEYLLDLWRIHGCTLEQIRWYEQKRLEYNEPWQIMQEFPTTPEEAFQYGSRRAIPAVHVAAARKTCKQPRIGTLTEEGGIVFNEDPTGPVRVWREPGDDYGGLLRTPEGARIVNRYVAVSDIGGVHPSSDFSVTRVMDRAPRLFGGVPEIVAAYVGHPELYAYAYDAMRLGRWYDDAYWAIESNSLYARFREQNDRDPDLFLAFLDEIRGKYPRIYQREVHDNRTDKRTQKLGFQTNAQTKGLAVTALKKALAANYLASLPEPTAEQALQLEQLVGKHGPLGYVERSDRACDEMDQFQEREGTYAAAEGMKDDEVDTTAILLYLDEDMPAVSAYRPERRRRTRTAGYASV